MLTPFFASALVPSRAPRVLLAAAPRLRQLHSTMPGPADPPLANVPSNFADAIRDVHSAISAAMAWNKRLLEVEFPPLATDLMESSDTSAIDVTRANLNLAVKLAEKFAAEGKSVAIMLPDQAEVDQG